MTHGRNLATLGALCLLLSLFAGPAVAQDEPPGLEQQLYQEFVRSVEEGLADGSVLRKRAAPPAALTKAVGDMRCLPTCDTTDGRFLALAPSNTLDTLSDEVLEFELAVEAGRPSFEFGVFDGDVGGTDGSGLRHWDFGTGVLDLILLADPMADGTGTDVVATWSNVAAPDNDWIDFAVATGPEAEAPSGHYFYRLQVQLSSPSASALNAFKLRTNGVVTVEVFQQPIGFIAQIAGLADAQTIFPAFPATTPTTYDGTLDFYLNLPFSEEELIAWGGDMDYGNYLGVTRDTDDPDTPNDVLPPWAGPGARLEGVAQGMGLSTGGPPDDRDPVGLGVYLLRSPSVNWELLTPTGETFLNENPAGNREWEQFRITTYPTSPGEADGEASALPPGTYRIRLLGLDMQNLNAFYFFRPLVCIDDLDGVCEPLRPFAVGDTVFSDLDGDGVQDPGESGIEGVEMELLDSRGVVVSTTVTDADGTYRFGVIDGSYTVRPAESSFEPGGALEGMLATTAAAMDTTVSGGNDLDLDFGFVGTGSIGDRLWVDADRDGVFDEPASAGIAGATVRLTGAGNDGIFDTADDVTYPSTTTDVDGFYRFDGLGAGLYRVDVDESTLPAGYELVSGTEPATVDLGPGEDVSDVDFGYFDPALAGELRPILECVSANGDGTYTAFFGYLNEHEGSIALPVGPANEFTPSPIDRGQPTLFSPGRTAYWPDAAFGVVFDGSNLVWSLGGRTATASSGSQPCAHHVFLEKIWVDGTGQEVPRPGSLPAGWKLVANSALGSAVCTYPAGATELQCIYDNHPPALDDEGLWVPVGMAYGVSEQVGKGGGHGGGRGKGDDDEYGYTAVDGVGSFVMTSDGNDACVGGRDGIAKYCTHTVVNAPTPPGTGTIGYWKNHVEDWPVETIEVGGVSYWKYIAALMMRVPTKGDPTVQLFKQLVAAKLNVLVGNPSGCIDQTIARADALLAQYPWGSLGNGGPPAVRAEMNALQETLDDYNNGQLCAPHRD